MWTILSKIKVTVFVVLAVTASNVRAEYTWNGSEWVWTENKNPNQSPQNIDYENEGSGDGGNYVDEDEDDTGFEDDYDYNEGSGSNPGSNPESTWSRGQESNVNPDVSQNNNNQQSRNNNYNPDPYNNYVDPYGGQNSQNNFQPTQPPYNNVVSANNDVIYVDPPGGVPTTTTTEVPPKDPSISSRPKNTSRSTSFFAQPGTLAAVIGGAVVGLLCAILCVMFVVYRMRKKDEGSYALDEPKRSPTVNAYAKHPSREFYA